MDAFNLLESSTPRRISTWLPLIGGLLASAAVASLLGDLPKVHSLSWAQLSYSAVAHELAAVLVAGITAWVLSTIAGVRGLTTTAVIVQTSFHAAWLIPLALFIRQDSMWALVVTALLVAGVTKSLGWLQGQPAFEQSEEAPRVNLGYEMFNPPGSSPWLPRQVLATTVALCAQMGLLAHLAGFPLAAVSLVGISIAAWSWTFAQESHLGNPRPPNPGSSSRYAAVMALGVLFTAGALLPYLRGHIHFRRLWCHPVWPLTPPPHQAGSTREDDRRKDIRRAGPQPLGFGKNIPRRSESPTDQSPGCGRGAHTCQGLQFGDYSLVQRAKAYQTGSPRTGICH